MSDELEGDFEGEWVREEFLVEARAEVARLTKERDVATEKYGVVIAAAAERTQARLAAESALAASREEVRALREALVEAESAMTWALDKSPEACQVVVQESAPWRVKARRLLSHANPEPFMGGQDEPDGAHFDGGGCGVTTAPMPAGPIPEGRPAPPPSRRCTCGAVGPPYKHFIDCSMLGLDFAHEVVKGNYKNVHKVFHRQSLTDLVNEAVDESLAEGARVVRQDEAHLFVTRILVSMPIENPWRVYDSSGTKVGAANVSFDDRGLMLHITLDKQTPEAFDMEVNTLKVQAQVNCSTNNAGALTGTITLKGL